MATIEKQIFVPETEEPQNDIPWQVRLLALSSLAKYIAQVAQRQKNLQRMDKIKNAVSGLSQAHFELGRDVGPEATELLLKTGDLQSTNTVIRRREEKLRLAQLQYDNQIFPVGASSLLAAESAPTYQLTVDENGELQAQALDPKTLQPLTQD